MADCRPRWRKENLIYCPVLIDHYISDFGAGLKNIVGGEVVAYTQLIADAREQALQRLKEDAAKLEADMIVGVRFTSTTIDTGISEILAYGTALKRIVDE